ncbi:permease prefix domain 1-containing protein [Streptomyces sp. NPDC002055]|uniref:permease prefix domain 1-containing protein n=1 Tax=Streptomyces sp. NPDC002055 TaxID=3154534 RepID=UPI0033274D57
MTAVGRPADPIDDYVGTLTAALHGPARAKARMIEEIRGGLVDTAAAHQGDAVPYASAAREAVREFGAAEELVPSCQRELTIAQARHTARVVALAAPFLVACWYLARTADRAQAGEWSRTAQMLAVHLAGVATVAALLAAVGLAATGHLARRLPTPEGLPRAVAWAGTTTSIAMAVATLMLAGACLLATDWPLLAFAGALAAVSHAVVAASARACRQCARLVIAQPAESRLRG